MYEQNTEQTDVWSESSNLIGSVCVLFSLWSERSIGHPFHPLKWKLTLTHYILFSYFTYKDTGKIYWLFTYAVSLVDQKVCFRTMQWSRYSLSVNHKALHPVFVRDDVGWPDIVTVQTGRWEVGYTSHTHRVTLVKHTHTHLELVCSTSRNSRYSQWSQGGVGD